MKKELPKAYEPALYEDGIYEKWEEKIKKENDSGYFNPDNLELSKNAKSYSIVMPPPNVTGTLHMGHAAMLAIEDILTRYHRMRGERALWLPGTDHAAIATQTKVEKLLKEKGQNRHSLGREEFLKGVNKFAQESHDTIVNQVKKMGSSCDWSREAYTLDEIRTRAVRTVFKMMYDDGLIYRGERIVNWCPRCHSTLADDETEYKAQKAKFYTFKYDEKFPIAISTTRPETKLGDTAVAVNPGDERYQPYVGKTFEADFVGVKLKIKVIADKEVDMAFGTGAVGVTPAHSMVDWQMAENHELDKVKVINENGDIREGFGEYSGKNVFAARKLVVEKLKERGLIEKEEEIDNNLSLCYRCDTPIEPLPSLQWFINVNKKITRRENKSIKELSIEAVRSGVFGREKINIIPERFEKNYFHWMENLRDWCISRQIWFGHRVPVWYREKSGSEKTKICFMRHGQTDWNIKSIMQGQTDTELNETGKKQAREKNKAIEDFKPDVIISSPLKRCLDTAKIAIGDKYEIITDDRLKERYYGEIEGMHINEIKEKYPNLESFTKNNLPYLIECPGGESYEEVYARAKDLLTEVVKKYPGKKVLIMSHGDPLDMMEAIIYGKEWKEGVGSWHDNTRCVEVFFSLSSGSLKAGFTESEDREIYVGIEGPEGDGWVQDEDTLDTWFSSGLWTFSTLAKKAEDIKIKDGNLYIDSDDFRNFHPTAVLETGYDILFFWVARMIIMTTYAVGEIPFQDVYLHGLIRDDKGRKMSKSLGNVIDPLDMIKKYGTDATRLSLVVGTTPGNDMNLSEEKIAGFRNFANKLWNIARYIITNSNLKTQSAKPQLKTQSLTEADKWILYKMFILTGKVTEDLDNYQFSQAGERLREFTWDDLADKYLEASKYEKSTEKEKILVLILNDLLKLWHPFIPFVTEAIWEEMGSDGLLISAKWPDINYYTNDVIKFSVESFGGFILATHIIKVIRNVRAENKVEPAKKIKAVIYAGAQKELIESQAHLIKNLRTGLSELEILDKGEKIEKAIYAAVGDVEIYLIGAIDEEKEKERIKKEMENLEKIIKITETKLNNKEFVERAPEKVVSIEKERLANAQNELKKLKEPAKT